MKSWFVAGLATLLFSIPSLNFAQTFQSEFTMEASVRSSYDVEVQMEQGLPLLRESLQEASLMLRDKNNVQAREAVLRGIMEADLLKTTLENKTPFLEIDGYLEKIIQFLTTAEGYIQNNQRQLAIQSLNQAYRHTKALEASPEVLKISAAELALNEASGLINDKNYEAAGGSLKRAIGYLNEAQKILGETSPELKKTIGELVVLHQQVILGLQAEKGKLKTFYPELAETRANVLTHYIWMQDNLPEHIVNH